MEGIAPHWTRLSHLNVSASILLYSHDLYDRSFRMHQPEHQLNQFPSNCNDPKLRHPAAEAGGGRQGPLSPNPMLSSPQCSRRPSVFASPLYAKSSRKAVWILFSFRMIICTAMAGCGKGEVALANQNKARFAPTPFLPFEHIVGINPTHKGYEHANSDNIFVRAGVYQRLRTNDLVGEKCDHRTYRPIAKLATPKCIYA